MSARCFPAPLLFCLVVLLSLGSADAPSPPTKPLTESEVMQAFVAGRTTAEIRAEIESRAPSYDLSKEMLRELRAGGLPEELIQAMRRRQTAWNTEQAPAPVPIKKVKLRIRLDPGTVSTSKLSIARKVSFDAAVALELGNSPEESEFTDLALYLACRTAEHVPDQWRLASPLGRALTMPRHEMLIFHGLGETGEAVQSKKLELDVPQFLEAEVEPGSHDLRLGVAVEVGGAYHEIAVGEKQGVDVPEGGLELPARLVRKRACGQKVLRIDFPDESGKAKPDEDAQDPDDPEDEGDIDPPKKG